MHQINPLKVNGPKYHFKDVLIIPTESSVRSRKEVNLEVNYCTSFSKAKISGVPIFCANMSTVGTVAMAEALGKHKIFTCLHKFVSNEDYFKIKENPYVFYTIGMRNDDLKKINELVSTYFFMPPRICIDVPHGHNTHFIEYCQKIREMCPESVVMAGNVCTPLGCQALISKGKVDIVKTGIAGGSACQTSSVAGVGYPQLSMIMECWRTCRDLGGYLCSDGGIKEIADFSKAFCAGADFVMAGGFFAGHEECDAEWEYEYERVPDEHGVPVITGNKLKTHMLFYGMSSEIAIKKFYGDIFKYKTFEGTSIKVPYKGTVENTVQKILGGLRSCGAYINARSLKDFHNNGDFVTI